MKPGYSKKQLKIISILIPAIGILVSSIYAISSSVVPMNTQIILFLHGILVTAGLWGGCALIVGLLWIRYPWEHHPLKHLVIEVIAITAWVFLFGYGLYVVEVFFKVIPDRHSDLDPVDMAFTLVITYFITSIHEAIFFYKQWKYNFSKSTRLEKDNIEAKYETLKSQINPHFLFNSLNSLSLIVDENEEATDYLQNLSEFLRYVLKSRDRELVLVRDEIYILKKYFNLQKSRFRENLVVDFNVDEKYYHYSLPPLVLQMLVENCIKHNVISKDKPLTIKVLANNHYIVVENNLQKKVTEISTKQGLRNISERFAFFTNKEVLIEEKRDAFTVKVPLLTVEM